MKAGPYTVIFCEADTGVVLNSDGSRFSSRDDLESYWPTIERIDDVMALKDKLLNAVPNGEVVIESADGTTESFRNDDKLIQAFLQERKEVYQWLSHPPWVRFFKRKPTCNVFPWDGIERLERDTEN
ncbi:MAG: hypothetical protein AAF585_18140 [Verrucomicrobiota bacterium]